MKKTNTVNMQEVNKIIVQKVVNGVKYNLGIHFSETSKKTMLDKIKKIVVKENEKNI